jgi:transposase InsO family protein
MARLCRRFEISRQTGYKWLKRQKTECNLEDHSRRPIHSPTQTPAPMEANVVKLRREHPAWGARKLRKVLLNEGVLDVPATSTITGILHRHKLIVADESVKHKAWQRFERPEPNELWQMDFKGYVDTDTKACHPLTVLDDHSRYAVGLFACGDEQTNTVRARLTAIFQRYGMPLAILSDNGPPWGGTNSTERYSKLSVWLMTLGIKVLHGRPRHPQTQGKDERFHRTLKAEVLCDRFTGLLQCQKRFDGWREEYNWKRPHEALELDVPGSHYRPSVRAYQEKPIQFELAPGQVARTVENNGMIRMWGRRWKVGQAFIGLKVAVEPTTEDGIYQVLYNGLKVKKLDQRLAR